MNYGQRINYKPGDWLAICDECGFRFFASELQKRYDGAFVCDKDMESRHPSETLKVRPEKGVPPWTRPEGTDTERALAPADPDSL